MQFFMDDQTDAESAHWQAVCHSCSLKGVEVWGEKLIPMEPDEAPYYIDDVLKTFSAPLLYQEEWPCWHCSWCTEGPAENCQEHRLKRALG